MFSPLRGGIACVYTSYLIMNIGINYEQGLFIFSEIQQMFFTMFWIHSVKNV